LLALAVRLALLPVRPIPEPTVQDEFSYLLGAETFCMGRVTNPPHPMWVHFETFQENFQPTYATKYPPAQSLFLALGWKLFGHPWYGVWLSCGFMCAALCWMLQGWLPPRYALLGGLMAVAQWGIAGYWINSYWGGAVAAAAGALVVGAVPRLARRPTAGVAALAALGVVALANSRPYEGAVTAAAGALWIWRRRAHKPFNEPIAWRMAPACAVLGCGVAAILYYNYRVTGHALLMPYAVYQAQYAASPIFWFMPPYAPPAYRHDLIRRFWTVYDMSFYQDARAWPPLVAIYFVRTFWYFFVTAVSAPALIAALLLRRGLKVRVALAIVGAATAGLLLERFPNAHYFAPATGAVLLLVLLGVQYLRVKAGAPGVAVFAALFFGLAAVHASRLTENEYPHKTFTAHRLGVIRRLESQGGRHLVIVRYAPGHDPLDEWVFNHADIDASTIVWARDMGEARNCELVHYYKERRVWLLEADAAGEKIGMGLPWGGLVGAGAASGAAACTPDSAAFGTGRVRLSAGRGNLLLGAGDQSAAPHVGTF
jgi:hypothetical protein